MTKAWAAAVLLCCASASASEVDVRVSDGGGKAARVEGGFSVDVPPSSVWEVLTDYDGIQGFVPSMKESRVEKRQGDDVLVSQEAQAKRFVFTRRFHVLLRVREEPPRSILFEDVSGKDFDVYRGSWQVVSSGGSSRVVYTLDAHPRLALPRGLMKRGFRGDVTVLLEQVRAEILRRADARIHASRP